MRIHHPKLRNLNYAVSLFVSIAFKVTNVLISIFDGTSRVHLRNSDPNFAQII